MINKCTVSVYNTNRWQPVTIEQIHTKVGAPVAGRPVLVDRDELPQPYSYFSPDYSSDFT